MTTTQLNPCDLDADDAFEVAPSLVGKAVRVTAGSMAFHATLRSIENGALVLDGATWSRRVLLSSVVRISESTQPVGNPGGRRPAPAPAPKAEVTTTKTVTRRVDADPQVCRVCFRDDRSWATVTTYWTETYTFSDGSAPRSFHTCDRHPAPFGAEA